MPPKRAPPPPPVSKAKPGNVTVYRALYKYDAAHSDELSFDEGDVIYVTGKGDDGWLKAIVNGKSGIIPGNYVEAEGGAESLPHPMHEAAKRGNLEFLQECIANRVSVNGLDNAGSTPLHWAARGGHADCVKALLSAPGIEVNVVNKIGDTALHGAAWKGHPETISLLLEAGADKKKRNQEGQTAYDLAGRNADAQQLLRAESRRNDDDDYEDSDED